MQHKFKMSRRLHVQQSFHFIVFNHLSHAPDL